MNDEQGKFQPDFVKEIIEYARMISNRAESLAKILEMLEFDPDGENYEQKVITILAVRDLLNYAKNRTSKWNEIEDFCTSIVNG